MKIFKILHNVSVTYICDYEDGDHRLTPCIEENNGVQSVRLVQDHLGGDSVIIMHGPESLLASDIFEHIRPIRDVLLSNQQERIQKALAMSKALCAYSGHQACVVPIDFLDENGMLPNQITLLDVLHKVIEGQSEDVRFFRFPKDETKPMPSPNGISEDNGTIVIEYKGRCKQSAPFGRFFCYCRSLTD